MLSLQLKVRFQYVLCFIVKLVQWDIDTGLQIKSDLAVFGTRTYPRCFMRLVIQQFLILINYEVIVICEMFSFLWRFFSNYRRGMFILELSIQTTFDLICNSHSFNKRLDFVQLVYFLVNTSITNAVFSAAIIA